MLQVQPLHQLKHVLQIFTDASKEGWGTHLNKHTARGNWFLPESKLHINYLELKAVFRGAKIVPRSPFCKNQMPRTNCEILHVFGTTLLFLKLYFITQLGMCEAFFMLEILLTPMGK